MCSSLIQATRIYAYTNKTKIPAFIEFIYIPVQRKRPQQRSKQMSRSHGNTYYGYN